jgi:hypothetical protein
VGLRTRRCIGVHDCYSFLTGAVLEEAFLGTVVACAGQAREVEENGHFVGCLSGGRGEVEVQGHFAACGLGFMGQFQKLAPKGGDCCFGLERHLIRFNYEDGDQLGSRG